MQVPENFPYFHVEFGCNGGFAHVIENAVKFDQYLGKSVIAGLLDIDANVYLKPKPQGFEADKKCVCLCCCLLLCPAGCCFRCRSLAAAPVCPVASRHASPL